MAEHYLSKIIFKKERENSYRISLGDIHRPHSISIETPPLITPFGIEKYMNKHIINIEFTNYRNDNKVYNFFADIKQIDNFMERLKLDENLLNSLDNKLPGDLIDNIRGKTYISCIRMRHNFDPLLRTHVMETKKVFTTKFLFDSSNNINIDHNSIKNNESIFVLRIGKLWITKKNYGVIIFVESCTLKGDDR